MNLKKSFLLFKEIAVSKKSLFWSEYLGLNGSLQRKIVGKGQELVLKISLPQTPGQIKLLLRQQIL
jgi:hypothetical protein